MKFDFCIGNPPYQEESDGMRISDKPVYHYFLDEASKISGKVEMIHPARFLFNAGATSKQWNEKMLRDGHFKVLSYTAKSTDVFPNTDIKGGLVVSYRDADKDFGAIKVFTSFKELNSIKEKVINDDFIGLDSIIFNENKFDLEQLYNSFPDMKDVIGSQGKERRLTTNIFSKVSLFAKEGDLNHDIKVIGLVKGKRAWRYIQKQFINQRHSNLYKWKVIVPAANGSGAIGEVLSTPLIGTPLIGYTQSFIGIGNFDDEFEAKSCLKYVKSKFARVMLGLLKVTQINHPETWAYVPLQDFTDRSDIDWSKSVHEIDLQLYRKYGLDEKEIAFIEENVKAMD